MPQAVGEAVLSAPIVDGQQIAVAVDIGNISQRLVAEAVRTEYGDAGLGMEFAVEAPGERDLPGIIEHDLAAQDLKHLARPCARCCGSGTRNQRQRSVAL